MGKDPKKGWEFGYLAQEYMKGFKKVFQVERRNAGRECQKLRMEGKGHIILSHQDKEKLIKIKLLILCDSDTPDHIE